MTNRQHWDNYTSSVCSPQNFIDWSIRSVIGAALQRRVSINGCPKYGHFPLFANSYTLLVGPAGVGKGVIIGPATDLLKVHKQKDFLAGRNAGNEKENMIETEVQKANLNDAEESTQQMKRGEKIDPPLFPYAADAITYEALVEAMGASFRRVNFKHIDESGVPKIDIYGHCSMYFSLPELASLMRKRTDDTVNYLLGLFDCPTDYEYKTKTKGQDRVKRGCLNILAGTTPEFMETIFDQQLIDQGFSSRVFFIFGEKNRRHIGLPEPLTKDQIESRKVLQAHTKKLAGLYGEVQISRATRDKFNNWWIQEQEQLAECSPKLLPFRARLNIHVLKVAMQEHFLERTDMELTWDEIEIAIGIVKAEMQHMHKALTFESDNPLAKVTDKVLKFIASHGKTSQMDLMTEFWKQLPQGKKSMEEILVQLIQVQKIKETFTEDPITKRSMLHYNAL